MIVKPGDMLRIKPHSHVVMWTEVAAATCVRVVGEDEVIIAVSERGSNVFVICSGSVGWITNIWNLTRV